MEILFGILIFICFISVVVFGANFITLRIILKEKNYKLSFFIFIIADVIKFKNLIKTENVVEKKKEYLLIYNWCICSLIILFLCGSISIKIFTILSE